MSSRTLKGNSKNLKYKRKLRSNMPEPERRLWNRLRSKQFHGLKFRKQHGIGPYIVDFFCPETAFVIEVDGDTHSENIQELKDKERDEYLSSLGVKVLRYTNREIMRNIEGVLSDLEERLTSGSTSPNPSLQRRGE